MARAQARVEVAGSVAGVEAAWYDAARWPVWVDGCERVVSVDGDWPEGGAVVWEAHPGGRGRVVERVVSFEPGDRQELHVEDPTIEGTQTVAFGPAKGGGAVVSLELRYKVRERNLFTPVVDVLFIRRAFRDSLRRTLRTFAAEVGAGPA